MQDRMHLVLGILRKTNSYIDDVFISHSDPVATSTEVQKYCNSLLISIPVSWESLEGIDIP